MYFPCAAVSGDIDVEMRGLELVLLKNLSPLVDVLSCPAIKLGGDLPLVPYLERDESSQLFRC